jgi:hypothetical protein
MKTLKTYGVIHPGGLEVGLRKDLDEDEKLACLWIKSPSKQQGIVGTWLTIEDARKLVRWLERFVNESDER